MIDINKLPENHKEAINDFIDDIAKKTNSGLSELCPDGDILDIVGEVARNNASRILDERGEEVSEEIKRRMGG